MNLFGLNPDDTFERIRASGRQIKPPTLLGSLSRGLAGFSLLGIAGFLPWVMGLARQFGEGGMYAICAVVFVVLSGPLMHTLIIGPGSLMRFYGLFLTGVLAYAMIWCAFWFGLKFPGKDYVGLAVGCAAFATLIALAFGSPKSAIAATLLLTICHATGYWVGAKLYSQQADWVGGNLLGVTLNKRNAAVLARSAWGLFYGMGFGAGLGLAFHVCQSPLRALLKGRGAMVEGKSA